MYKSRPESKEVKEASIQCVEVQRAPVEEALVPSAHQLVSHNDQSIVDVEQSNVEVVEEETPPDFPNPSVNAASCSGNVQSGRSSQVSNTTLCRVDSPILDVSGCIILRPQHMKSASLFAGMLEGGLKLTRAQSAQIRKNLEKFRIPSRRSSRRSQLVQV